MKYYILKNKITSVYPQVESLNQNDAHKFRTDRFTTFNPVLNYRLKQKAKFTDILTEITVSATGLLINERTKHILNQFNIFEHRIFPSSVEASSEKYFYIQIVTPLELLSWIDFPNSKFYSSIAGSRKKEVKLKSFDHYLKKKKTKSFMWCIEIESLSFNSLFNYDIDLFTIPYWDINIFISERLKKALVQANISGIDINEAPHFI